MVQVFSIETTCRPEPENAEIFEPASAPAGAHSLPFNFPLKIDAALAGLTKSASRQEVKEVLSNESVSNDVNTPF